MTLGDVIAVFLAGDDHPEITLAALCADYRRSRDFPKRTRAQVSEEARSMASDLVSRVGDWGDAYTHVLMLLIGLQELALEAGEAETPEGS